MCIVNCLGHLIIAKDFYENGEPNIYGGYVPARWMRISDRQCVYLENYPADCKNIWQKYMVQRNILNLFCVEM